MTGQAFHELGREAKLGDVNGDGRADLLLGSGAAPAEGGIGFAGRSWIYHGPVAGNLDDTDSDATLSGAVFSESFGDAIATGDINGDGRDDLIVGATQFPLEIVGTGKVYIFFAPVSGSISATNADVVVEGEAINDSFGSRVASAGDANGDGIDDLLVGANQIFQNDDAPGRAYLFHGPLSGAVSAANADAILVGEVPNSLFETVAFAGDVNGDGLDDLAVGAVSAGPEGRTYVFLSPLTGTVSADAADLIFEGPGFDPFTDRLGQAVAPAGDLDSNGFDDLLLGAPGFDADGFARIFFAPGLNLAATPLDGFLAPAAGGSLSFELLVANSSTATQRFDLWVRLSGPGVELELEPRSMTLEPGSDLSQSRTVALPDDLPSGRYEIEFSAGRFPDKTVSSSLEFAVL